MKQANVDPSAVPFTFAVGDPPSATHRRRRRSRALSFGPTTYTLAASATQTFSVALSSLTLSFGPLTQVPAIVLTFSTSFEIKVANPTIE
ncbi:MAG: hypothetical protein ACHREM_18470 [Polyangiales bacterium]